LKVEAIFCDYDGTLAPFGVARSKSRVPRELAITMRRVNRTVTVGIVTAKDFFFIRPRTPFADGWSCVYGAETVLKDGTRSVADGFKDIAHALEIVRSLPGHPHIEYKRTSKGELCGLGVEWRPSHAPTAEEIYSRISNIKAAGMQVLHDPLYPMIDITSSSRDKGDAVRVLKDMLGVSRGLMFVGDSVADNPAFAVADIRVGILGSRWEGLLKCDYFVAPNELGRFFEELLQGGMKYSSNMRRVRAKGGSA
jgi:hypothetical protein